MLSQVLVGFLRLVQRHLKIKGYVPRQINLRDCCYTLKFNCRYNVKKTSVCNADIAIFQ